MNIKQLTAFREVMQAGSVSAAARNLHRTQPAISALISNLESEIGLKLFVRRSGRLHPVPEAHYLLEQCDDILGRISATRSVLEGIRALDHGVVRVVSMPGPSVFLLPNLICRFAQGKNHVRTSIITRSSPAVQHLVSAQQYDVGLADIGSDDPVESDLVDHDIMRFECLCGVHKDDPLAERDTITADDLNGAPMAALFGDHSTTAHIKSAFQDARAVFDLRFEAQYFIPLFTFVEQRLAYVIVDPLSAESYRLYRSTDESLVFRPFRPVIYLVASIMTPTHRPPSILAGAFISLMKRELRRIQTLH
jgi:DNA-binding transcriptional LysR family regulator